MGEGVQEDRKAEPVDIAERNAWRLLDGLCQRIHRQWVLQEFIGFSAAACDLQQVYQISED